MVSVLQDLVPWGYTVIQSVQELRHPVLDVFFKFITVFGDKEAYLTVLPIVYWCIDAKVGRRLFLLILTSLGLNSFLKYTFTIPRPDASKVTRLVIEQSPSFPSGHAQGTSTLWGYLATQWAKLWFRIAVVALILLVGMSRIYLGAHFPQDVLGGWLLTLTVVGLFLWLEPKVLPHLQGLPWWGQCLIAVLLPIAPFVITPSKTLAMIVGAFMGFGIGISLERRFVRFDSSGTTKQRLLRLFGLIVLVVVWLGSKPVLSGNHILRIIRYVLVGMTVSYVIPVLFIRLGWAQKEDSKTS